MLRVKQFQGIHYVKLRTEIMTWLEEHPNINVSDIVENKTPSENLTPIVTTIKIYYFERS